MCRNSGKRLGRTLRVLIWSVERRHMRVTEGFGHTLPRDTHFSHLVIQQGLLGMDLAAFQVALFTSTESATIVD